MNERSEPLPGMTVPAITLWQPWATLVSAGAKPFEFRGWPAPRRLWGKRVAVMSPSHAGARPMRRGELQDLLLRLQGDDAPETGLVAERAIEVLERALSAPGTLPRASVLCLATLGEPIRDEALAARLGLPSVNDSDRTQHSSWGWPLTGIERLEPFVPARGAQGWWAWRRAMS